VKDGFDAAFRLFGKKPKSSGLIARKVGELAVQFYAAPAYLAARGTPRTPEDLHAHDCLAFTRSGPFSLDGISRVRIRLRTKVIADDGFFVREAARLGMGIAILPVFLAQQDVLAGRLVRVLPRWRIVAGGVFLVLPSVTSHERRPRSAITSSRRRECEWRASGDKGSKSCPNRKAGCAERRNGQPPRPARGSLLRGGSRVSARSKPCSTDSNVGSRRTIPRSSTRLSIAVRPSASLRSSRGSSV
jgi:hypothetical protein